MSETTQAVETKVEVAATQPGAESTHTDSQVDFAAIMAAKDEELAKVKLEKENYRKGLLKAKGKIPDVEVTDDDTTETQEEMTRRIVREEQLAGQEAQLSAEKDAALAAIIKQNQELRLAMKSQNAVGSGGVSGNQAKNEIKVTTDFFSAEQLADLKKRNLDPEKVKANLLKLNSIPKVVT